MSKLKRKFGRRILAYILSGAMIMSNMTVFASELPESTGGGYYEETVETDDTDSEDTAETVESEKASQGDGTVSEEKEEAETEETATSSEETDAVGTEASDEEAVEIETTASTEETDSEIKKEADDNKEGEESGNVTADEDGFYNGLEVSEAAAGASYYYDFTGEEFKGIPNSYEKGLFSFNAGNYNAASYNGATYGIEFKSGNKLTFQVSGNSYIVVGGDNNNTCTDLAASSSTGTLSPETATTKTSGHATLANCKERGDNTVVYEYAGEQGTVTLTVDPSYTKAEGQTSTRAYIAYVCVIPKEEGGEDGPVADEDGFYNGLEASEAAAGASYYYDFTGEEFKGIPNSYEKGLFSFNAGNYNAASYNGATYGIEFKSGNKLTFQVSGNSYIVVGGDSNNTCTDLAASSSTGTLSPETATTKTSGHATLANCKKRGDNTVVYEYEGEQGTVTLTVDPSYTKAEGQTSTKAYIAYVCVIPKEEGGEDGPVADEDGFYNGLEVSEAAAGASYYYDFTGEEFKGIPNSYEKGLFSFNAGNYNAASYNGATYGIEFKSGNKLTFQVSGNSYIVVGGDNNNTCTDLAASSSTGTLSPETATTKTSGHATLANCKERGDNTVVYEYEGEQGTVTLTVDPSYTKAEGQTSTKAYIAYVCVIPKEEGGEDEPVEELDTTHIAVWDFNADALDTEKYYNMLTAEDLNNAIGDVSGGQFTSSFIINADDEEKYLEYSSKIQGVGKNTRLYADNKALDASKLAGAVNDKWFKGVCNGALYVNAQSPEPYLSIYAKEGDIIQVVAGGNNGDSTVAFEQMNASNAETQTAVAAKSGSILTFYATANGQYKIYSVDEKLVVGRITREHTDKVKVSGTVTAPESLSKSYSVAFTCQETGATKTAKVTDGGYSLYLNEGYSYNVALADANGYVVKNEKPYFTLAGDSIQVVDEEKTFTYDVEVEAVDLVTMEGSVTGLAAVAGGDQNPIKNLKLSFESDNIYVPELKLNLSDGTFMLSLEKGVEYTVVAEGVNDFTLDKTTISASEDITEDISFTAKPVYNVAITPEGVMKETLATTSFIFSRVNIEGSVREYEEDYVYTFTGTEGITLRDGQYEVSVGADCPYTMKITSDLKVEGKDVEKVIKFDPNPKTSWDFRTNDYTGQTAFGGLTITGGKKHGDKYGMQIKDGIIEIPVPGACTITVSVGYNWDVYIEGSETRYTDETDSGDIDVTFEYTGETGTVKLLTGSDFTSYIKKIELKSNDVKTEYKDTITVGATGCDYTSINDALDAVAKMDRTDNQRVTIAIQPGDYEEMLVVDVPNVTLKNASAAPSIATKDKGVNIDENAVRITSYYGHGYAYYSMGNDCKWDADLLAANKENGAYSYQNPGSGTTDGSYWNATVVIGADGFEADGIIFENSFNQYVSKKAAEDVIVPLSGAKEGSVARASMKAGDTTVQNKAYVERAAALAIMNNYKNISFDNCKFIGRQDTLYGGVGVTAAFYDCSVYGGTDYIFGGMTAVFAKCDLVFNTSETNTDVGYITAAQQSSGRGYLMYNCHVTSTTPGVDTASEKTSKPGLFGRPWAANTGEALFYKTIIGKTDYNGTDESLIQAVGWDAGLGGKSVLSQEYASIELAGVDNSKKRVDWSSVLTADAEGNITLADGNTKVTDATVVAAFLGDWDAFAGKDMAISATPVTPEDSVVETPEASPAAGSVAVGTKVTLTSKTEGAAIYYTTNGDVPTTGSKLYTDAEPIIITEAVTIKAIAVKEGMKDSAVAEFTYTISASDEPVVVTTIKLEDCAIAVPSILADSKKNPDNVTNTSVVYYTDKDKDGNPINPVRFAEGLDYKVQWNGLKAGTENVYTVTLTGLGRAVDQYRIDTASTVTKEYKVFDKSDKSVVNLSKAKITLDSSAKSAVYTGYAITPAVTEVKVGKDVIPATKYKVSYKSNINAGKATVIVTADSDAEYAEGESFIIGSKTITFTIKKAAINKGQVTVTALDKNGKEFGSEPYAYRGIDAVEIAKLSVVSSGGKALKENIDYTVTYKNNRKAGNATATIKGIGNNVSGSWTKKFTIEPLDIGIDSSYKISTVSGSLQYSPSGAKLGYICVYNENDEIYLEEGVDFKVTYTYADKKTKAAGTTVDFVGKGINACKGSFSNKDTVFTIQKAYFGKSVYLSNEVIVDETKAALEGDKLQKALEKAAVVYDAYGTKLKVKKDYSVTPTTMNGKDVITISPAETVKDNYYNEYNSCSYYYYRAKNIAKLKKVEFAKDYVLLYDGRNPVELTADDIKALGTYEFVLGKDVEIVEGSYKNNYKAGTASVTIRGISHNGYYGTKTIKFKIKEA